MAQIAPTIGIIASLAGTAISAVGSIAAGNAARRDAEFQAAQMDIQSKQEYAAAQREAQEIERQKKVVMSRQQALSAASGLGAADDTVLEIAAETAGYGEEQKQSALAQGEMRRRQLEYGAAGTRATGTANQIGSYFNAGSTIMGGFANAFEMKYGSGGYKPANSVYGAAGSWYG